MRAVTLVTPGQVEIVDDWPEPECGPHDVVVQIRGVGLCGSDLSVFDGKRAVPHMPWVFGHEGGGNIVAVGSQVRDRQIGQRVVVEPNFADGTCPACRAGHSSACVDREILAITRQGILAERVAIPAEYTWPIPPTWPDVALACFEPLAVADTAVRRAKVPPGTDCLVIGAGSQGQLVCQSLLAGGAQPYVTEPHPGRMELALKFGARRADEHDGDTYPFVFETAGVPAVWDTAFAAVAKTGTLVVIGFSQKPAQFTTHELVQRQITIVGQLIYDHPQDFAATLESVTSGRLAPEQTVQASFPVEETAAALASVREVPGKSWIDFSSWRGDGTA
ncbi:MAG TPA: alcohol dehydrogenase catalytic domain-containing protein [Pseudonocardiaceae bacterium]|jgi:2-desacetyl-2-hydroxyethyl bacteriochlorophyllide A dehydrogenase|nr:alcohol dehydrogenase catalytic domain-containing protein [Pseudonocardiaceae bacterium]